MVDLDEARATVAKANQDADEKLFRRMLDEIPIKIKENSLQGKNFATVAQISEYRFRWYHFFSWFLEWVMPKHLVGAYKRIFDHCKKEGLKPYIQERGYDGGMFFIMIRW